VAEHGGHDGDINNGGTVRGRRCKVAVVKALEKQFDIGALHLMRRRREEVEAVV
jgi:hypothetical protein